MEVVICILEVIFLQDLWETRRVAVDRDLLKCAPHQVPMPRQITSTLTCCPTSLSSSKPVYPNSTHFLHSPITSIICDTACDPSFTIKPYSRRFSTMAAEPVEPPITLSAAASAAMEEYNSAKVTLADYCAKATAKYAQKNFEEAAELYSQASEMQVELNGEMSPENAEILFLYGRALFKVGQKQSDILNGGAGEKKKKKTKKANGAPISKKEAVQSEDGELEAVAEADEGEKVIEKVVASEENELEPKKALFTFTGDENFDDSEEDEVCSTIALFAYYTNYRSGRE